MPVCDSERKPSLAPHQFALVAVGGAGGTALRSTIDGAFGPQHGFPVATFLVNITGALALAILVEALALRGRDAGRRRLLRLLLGTGFLGGYTTYSALAVETSVLLRDGLPLVALAYAVSTLVVGLVATVLGIAAARSEFAR